MLGKANGKPNTNYKPTNHKQPPSQTPKPKKPHRNSERCEEPKNPHSATMSATSGNSATQGRVDVHNEHSSPSSHIPNPYLMHMRTICGPLHGGGEAHPTITNHQSPAIFAEPVSALQIYYWRARI
jgi:hypothetical protein